MLIIFFSLALRNLWKQRRRSAVTLLAVAMGFTAVNLFAGYIANVYSGIQHGAIHGEGLGHLTIAREGFHDAGGINPRAYLLGAEEVAQITAIARSLPDVALVTPRLAVSGLMSNGKVSTIFVGTGENPADRARIHEAVRPANAAGGTLAAGLARNLQARPGDDVTLLAATMEGQTNALDMSVADVADTGIAETNDKLTQMPLSLARTLLDTEGADRLIVLLDRDEATEATRRLLEQRFAQAGLKLEVRSWQELSHSYRPVKAMFDMIFMFISTIVLVIVLTSIVNTMSTTVMERVREIGTLRALGMERAGVRRLFSIEGLLLGLAGCLVGAVATSLLTGLIDGAGIHYTPPGYSTPVSLSVLLLPSTQAVAAVLLTLIGALAALLPARRAARLDIVDALGHV
jgi:putative ABC transport system permease protein